MKVIMMVGSVDKEDNPKMLSQVAYVKVCEKSEVPWVGDALEEEFLTEDNEVFWGFLGYVIQRCFAQKTLGEESVVLDIQNAEDIEKPEEWYRSGWVTLCEYQGWSVS